MSFELDPLISAIANKNPIIGIFIFIFIMTILGIVFYKLMNKEAMAK